jgi:hypothetical protein
MYKIISNGTAIGTSVYYQDIKLEDVIKLSINIDYSGVTAVITVLNPEVQINVKEHHVQRS